ncbi:MAG: PH domain-containing protein [Candidatus Omnitrophica bacterium]|nr:PH domain-containing protein [Candidatus Omnitrophota bacterium]
MIPENKLPHQFRSVKDNDEEFIWIGEPKWLAFMISGVPLLIFGLIWGVFDFAFITMACKAKNGPPLGVLVLFFSLHSLPFWLGITNMARLLLAHKNTFYAITNKRLMIRSGFWGIDFSSIDYDKISDVQVTVNPVENIMKVGTIRFSAGRISPDGTSLTDNFIGVENPYEVFKRVKTTMVDVKTDWNYPNKFRPDENPGYNTKYDPK